MKLAAAADIVKGPNFLRIASISFLSLSLILLFLYHLPSQSFPFLLSTYYPTANATATTATDDAANTATTVAVNETAAVPPLPEKPPLPPPTTPPPKAEPVAMRMGIVDESGVMTGDFVVGELDPIAEEESRDLSGGREEEKSGVGVRVSYEKYRVCEESKSEYIPCLDNVEEIQRLNLSGSVEKFERHCPKEGQGLDCLVPMPKDYKRSIPWPQSRDEVWFSNVPHARLVEDKGGQNWIAIKNDRFIFPGGGTQFIHGADQYLDQILQMVPDIAFGQHTRTALDIGCGVASFGAFLLQRNVTTLSIAPKDEHENQIQFALERGVPAMVAIFGTRRLLYPSQAFDLMHCSRCRIDWTRDGGILLLEANRMLRAGGYFVWAAQPVYKHEENLQEQWKEMQDLTSRICWKLVKKEGYIAIWQKPLDNSCYLNRDSETQPPLCDADDDPDNVWYVGLKACIARLPENGYGANVTGWPVRLHYPPDRLQSIKMDATISRKEIFKAESQYWNEIIDGYVRVFRWREMGFHNVIDMRAGFGGFGATLHDFQIDCWVMNVVPVNEFNTLPVIYDRGLIGVMHDWCEPFDTYPRTYDLLHAAGLFSVEQRRRKCNISTIMLEMDRILRPSGIVYIRDTKTVVSELQLIATAMGWATSVRDVGEGPHASWKMLICEKHKEFVKRLRKRRNKKRYRRRGQN